MFGRFSFRSIQRSCMTLRKMGGHSHAKAAPQGGLDGAVRKYLPEDEHLVLGIFAFYLTLYGLSKVYGFATAKKIPVAVSAAAISSEPSTTSSEFSLETFLSGDKK